MEVKHMEVAVDRKVSRRVMLSYPEFVAGTFFEFTSPIDAMIYHVCKVLGLKPYIVDYKGSRQVQIPKEVRIDLGLDTASISRCRGSCGSKAYPRIPEQWLLRFHQYSGVPLADLYAIAGYQPTVLPHFSLHKAKTIKVEETNADNNPTP